MKFFASASTMPISHANLLVPFSRKFDQVNSCSSWQKQIWLHFMTKNEASANGHKVQP
jgi:hypothetical protein